jgi:hypothetical protein
MLDRELRAGVGLMVRALLRELERPLVTGRFEGVEQARIDQPATVPRGPKAGAHR